MELCGAKMKLTNKKVNTQSSLQDYVEDVFVGDMFDRFGEPNTNDPEYVAWNFEHENGKVVPVYGYQKCDEDSPWDYGMRVKIGGDCLKTAKSLRKFLKKEFGVIKNES